MTEERVKAFMTQSKIQARFAWDRTVTERAMWFALIGTRNNDTPIPSSDAFRRRVYVVEVAGQGVNPLDMFAEHRNQLWAEALQLYREGLRPTDLPSELESAQYEASAGLAKWNHVLIETIQDVLEDMKAKEYIRHKDLMQQVNTLLTADGFQAVSEHQFKQTMSGNIGANMKTMKHGWTWGKSGDYWSNPLS